MRSFALLTLSLKCVVYSCSTSQFGLPIIQVLNSHMWCMKVKSESEVAQSCLTLSNPMDCSPPGSSVRGMFQARVLEWGAIAFSAKIL